jgi:Uma2 family endonuclease
MSQPPVTSPNLPRQLPADDIIVLHGVTWADYQRHLEIRGERAVPRLTYLEGALELMTPYNPHESIKSMIGRLIEAWCLEHGVGITPYGSWTLEWKESDRGVEPDECYVLGDAANPDRPDIAIGVIWSSGGINKLEVYKKLGVREVWIWKKGTIEVYSLRGESYERIERSALLPGIDFPKLLSFMDVRPMTRAVTEYRAALRADRT